MRRIPMTTKPISFHLRTIKKWSNLFRKDFRSFLISSCFLRHNFQQSYTFSKIDNDTKNLKRAYAEDKIFIAHLH